jgi:lysophospholipase L1-like esterase
MPSPWRLALALIVLAAALLALHASGGAEAGDEPAFKAASGDVDCSGEVDAVDALRILRLVARLDSGVPCPDAADVDCSGDVSATDAGSILRHVVGFVWFIPPIGCPPIGELHECGDPALPQEGTYIALGDSLSVGVGATDPSRAFVPRVHACLGDGFELINLGHSGDTSEQLLSHGHLAAAVAEVQARNGDQDPDNDVRLITIEIGGNDLLGLFFSLVLPGTCPTVEVSLTRQQCVEALRSVLDALSANLEEAFSTLREAAPGVPIVTFTLYNPLTGLAPGPAALADLALEGIPDTAFPSAANDVIREGAMAAGIYVADVYPLFQKAELDYISGDYIHPNNTGYGVIAGAVLAAIGMRYEP